MRSTLHMLLAAALLLGTASAQSLNGAGATFPNPIYQKWFSEYHNANQNITINYQSVGSGAGIAQLTAGTVDFGASDGPMTDEQLGKVSGKVFHIPTVLGAVVLTYNVPGVSSELKFTPDAIAGIYLGKIKKWNDAELTKSNPGVKLPDTDIVVVHRSDGSGTTYIFTDYLSKVNQEWANSVKKGTSVNWPTGLGAKGNEGVSGQVKQTEGAIGYVELIYALSNKMSYGVVKNSAGNWVKASLDSVTAAAASSKDMPDDFRVSITNAPGKDAYPISSFTWLLVPAKWSDASKEKAFVNFLNWMVDKGQTMTTSLEYAPLPKNVAAKVKARIKEIQ
jgi:phosphate transport system substrate-binding protein